MARFYNITKARGGKYDSCIERGLKDKANELKAGSKIEIVTDPWPGWQGKDRVDIHSDVVHFLDRIDHTFSPAAIKATVPF